MVFSGFMATGVTVGEIMRKAVITVKKNDTLEKTIKTMGNAGIGGVIVTEDGNVIGILTEKDIIRDVLAKGHDYKKLIVEDIMKHPVRTVPPDIDLEDAMKIMRDLDIERLPVVSDRLAGLVTARDLIRIEPALLEMMKEKEVLIGKLSKKESSLSGECEICGNYSDNLRIKDSAMVCEDCR